MQAQQQTPVPVPSHLVHPKKGTLCLVVCTAIQTSKVWQNYGMYF